MKLPRRRWLLVPLMLFALAFGLCVVFGKSMYVTEAQVEQVRIGMTLAKVEAILGKHHYDLGDEAELDFWDTWTGAVSVTVKDNRVDRVENCRAPNQWDLWTNRLRRKLGW